jgi:aspartyl-tRNA synthetase
VTRTLIAELRDRVGEQVTIRGWVHAVRDQKRMQFLVIRDESGLAQVVLAKEEEPSELNQAVSALTAESAVTTPGRCWPTSA